MKLTDTHLVLLTAAAQRPDRLLVRPEGVIDKPARALADKLMRAGLIEEVSVSCKQPAWTENADRSFGLRITRGGLAAIHVEEGQPAENEDKKGGTDEEIRRPGGEPRPGTKQALIIAILQRDEGATLDELIGATGWLPTRRVQR